MLNFKYFLFFVCVFSGMERRDSPDTGNPLNLLRSQRMERRDSLDTDSPLNLLRSRRMESLKHKMETRSVDLDEAPPKKSLPLIFRQKLEYLSPEQTVRIPQEKNFKEMESLSSLSSRDVSPELHHIYTQKVAEIKSNPRNTNPNFVGQDSKQAAGLRLRPENQQDSGNKNTIGTVPCLSNQDSNVMARKFPYEKVNGREIDADRNSNIRFQPPKAPRSLHTPALSEQTGAASSSVHPTGLSTDPTSSVSGPSNISTYDLGNDFYPSSTSITKGINERMARLLKYLEGDNEMNNLLERIFHERYLSCCDGEKQQQYSGEINKHLTSCFVLSGPLEYENLKLFEGLRERIESRETALSWSNSEIFINVMHGILWNSDIKEANKNHNLGKETYPLKYVWLSEGNEILKHDLMVLALVFFEIPRFVRFPTTLVGNHGVFYKIPDHYCASSPGKYNLTVTDTSILKSLMGEERKNIIDSFSEQNAFNSRMVSLFNLLFFKNKFLELGRITTSTVLQVQEDMNLLDALWAEKEENGAFHRITKEITIRHSMWQLRVFLNDAFFNKVYEFPELLSLKELIYRYGFALFLESPRNRIKAYYLIQRFKDAFKMMRKEKSENDPAYLSTKLFIREFIISTIFAVFRVHRKHVCAYIWISRIEFFYLTGHNSTQRKQSEVLSLADHDTTQRKPSEALSSTGHNTTQRKPSPFDFFFFSFFDVVPYINTPFIHSTNDNLLLDDLKFLGIGGSVLDFLHLTDFFGINLTAAEDFIERLCNSLKHAQILEYEEETREINDSLRVFFGLSEQANTDKRHIIEQQQSIYETIRRKMRLKLN